MKNEWPWVFATFLNHFNIEARIPRGPLGLKYKLIFIFILKPQVKCSYLFSSFKDIANFVVLDEIPNQQLSDVAHNVLEKQHRL